MSDLIIIGGGGHARVVADIAKQNGYTVRGFLDDADAPGGIPGCPHLGKVADCVRFADAVFAFGIGNGAVRRAVAETYDLPFVTLVHPTACVGSGVTLGRGTVVMPYAVLNACAAVGDGCVINTASVVEHDCKIGDFTLIAPHATLCGAVEIGCDAWIGAAATVNQTVRICDGVTVGSGAVVTRDITEQGTYVGVPAKKL